MSQTVEPSDRLAEVDRVFKKRVVVTQASRQETLLARAEQLAQVPPHEDRDETLQLVEFTLGQGRYALAAEYIRKVLVLEDLTPLPGVPRFVSGVTSLRGEIIAVIDLARILGLSEQTAGHQTRLIVLSGQGREFALLVDAIGGVLSLPGRAIQAPIATLAETTAQYVYGETADHLLVLDAAKLLADDRLTVNEDITPHA